MSTMYDEFLKWKNRHEEWSQERFTRQDQITFIQAFLEGCNHHSGNPPQKERIMLMLSEYADYARMR